MDMMAPDDARTCIVFDFETTGLSPDHGDRSIEIGAVRLEGGVIVDRFQSLMHPGRIIPPFIEDYTGISNAMIADAEPCAVIMQRFFDFAEGAIFGGSSRTGSGAESVLAAAALPLARFVISPSER